MFWNSKMDSPIFSYLPNLVINTLLAIACVKWYEKRYVYPCYQKNIVSGANETVALQK
jgi:hypothetical protein